MCVIVRGRKRVAGGEGWTWWLQVVVGVANFPDTLDQSLRMISVTIHRSYRSDSATRLQTARPAVRMPRIYILTAELRRCVASRPVIGWLLPPWQLHTYNRWLWRRQRQSGHITAVVFQMHVGDNYFQCYRLHYPRWPARYIISVEPARWASTFVYNTMGVTQRVARVRLRQRRPKNRVLLLPLFLHCESKKQDTKLLPITSPNINRFLHFFYC